jgi:hypothetical protein
MYRSRTIVFAIHLHVHASERISFILPTRIGWLMDISGMRTVPFDDLLVLCHQTHTRPSSL